MQLEIIKEIISKSIFYSSGDNCQPFKFRIQQNTVEIIFQQDLAQHELDFLNLASYISLGSLVYLIQINSAERGLSIQTDLEIDSKALSPFVRITFQESQNITSAQLCQYIVKRRTYRGSFKNVDLPLDFLNAYSGRKNILIQNKLTPEIVKSICEFEIDFWNNENGVKDLFKHVHLTMDSYSKSKEGIYWHDLFLNFQETPSVILFKLFSKLPSLLISVGGKALFINKCQSILKNASLVIFPIDDIIKSSPLKLLPAMFELGKLSMEFWLTATRAGLFIQPVSMSSFSTFYSDPVLCSYSKRKLNFNLESLKEKSNRLRTVLNLEHGRSVGWIFRMGTPVESDFKKLEQIPRERFLLEDILI